MRNLIIAAITAAALLGAPVAAEAATADAPWTPVTYPLGPTAHPNGPVTLPAGQSCAFALNIAVVTNKELQQITKLAGGTTVARLKGQLILSFKNNTTGKTIQEDVSGSATATMDPHGNVTFQGVGPNWLVFGPHGQVNTKEPGLVFTSGQVTVTYTGGIAQKFSLHGTQQNGCALLS